MLKQPISVVTLTNVAFIKYKMGKQKFEIACYKNKAINWRNGIETDLSEVLQIDQIFLNASHGLVANKSELDTYFPGLKKQDIVKLILDKGEL